MEATRMIMVVEELTEKVEILVGAGCADSLQFRHSQIDKVFEELCSLPKGNHWRFLQSLFSSVCIYFPTRPV